MSDARDILDKVAKGEMTPEEAELQLRMKPFVDLGFAKPDLHRGMRQGVPEVIFGQGKTPEQIDAITKSLLEAGQKTVLITRLSAE
nr:1-(5-phosphoribosyl)-5-amino-4-imidazole-carboxylate carboxylase [Saccharofermentans sp.]